MSSAINAVRTGLASVWQAQLTTDGITEVTVRKYHPADEQGKTDVAYISALSETRNYLTFTKYSFEITATAYVVTHAPGTGDTAVDAAEDRALAIADSLDAALRADGSLGSVTGVENAYVRDVTSDIDVTPEGYFCTAEIEIEVGGCT